MDLDLLENKLFDREKPTPKKRRDTSRGKVTERVFDDQTLLTLYNLTKKGAFTRLVGIVSTGKEANVFYGLSNDDGEVAVKIYSMLESDFKNRRPPKKLNPSIRKLSDVFTHLGLSAV